MTDTSTEAIEKVVQGLRPMNGSNEMDIGVAVIEALAAERDRCHARLEITHITRGLKGAKDGWERVEIPMEDRPSQLDGIYCRDAEIELLKDEFAQLREALRRKDERDALRAENEALREALERIANHLPSFDYVGSDEFGIRTDIPGSPYDRGKEDANKLLADMARTALKGDNDD